ncbi:MAG TPA: hypothetical protein VE978_13805 [Chitinophagales bacterium]|nr:hypothetical protein [Chitinophagales bacterium]
MKCKLIFLFLTVISLASCDEIYFDRIPGQLLSSIPDKFVGEYDVYDHKSQNGKETAERNDSFLTVTKTSLNFHDKEIPLLNLNDTFTVSEYKGYHFISLRRQPEYWTCFILQETKRGFIGTAVLFTDDSPDKGQSSINEIKKYFPDVKVILMKKKDGSAEEEFYTQMNEEQVIAFFIDAVKKPEYSEFVKK